MCILAELQAVNIFYYYTSTLCVCTIDNIYLYTLNELCSHRNKTCINNIESEEGCQNKKLVNVNHYNR